ncbi:hypothetical protein [Fluviispira vulneris]|uniref:hypothetical protein n=1 Tax=Fluviispira vulneris TaxID=2763012 RepID=UPI001646EA6A|nr:hypothetical protein [Fluviispira vulneris]
MAADSEKNNEENKNDLSLYFQAIKRAEHIYDTITNIRELSFGAAIALVVIGSIKDFLVNSNDNSALLSSILIVKDFNHILIHDLKISFILVFCGMSALLVLFTKEIEFKVYRPRLHGVLNYLIEFEKKASEKEVSLGFKENSGLIKLEKDYAKVDTDKNIAKLYYWFIGVSLGLGIIGGYLINIDACRVKSNFNKYSDTHIQCSLIKEEFKNSESNPVSKFVETTKCECVPD